MVRVMLASVLSLIAAATPVPLQPLAGLVGHCWRADIAKDVTDTHCFEAVYDGGHIRDRHAVTQAGKTVYAGETIYSAEAGKLVFTYFNSLGGVGRGTASTESGRVHFIGAMRGTPDATPQPIDSTGRIEGDGYEVTNASGKPLRFGRVGG